LNRSLEESCTRTSTDRREKGSASSQRRETNWLKIYKKERNKTEKGIIYAKKDKRYKNYEIPTYGRNEYEKEKEKLNRRKEGA
jgi:hypothetical protein